MKPYDMWTSILGEHFFGPEMDQQSVVIFVDDRLIDDLQRLDVNPDLPLVESVRAQLGSSRRLLDPVISRVAAWRRDDDGSAPPYLPLLAVTVLAASHMVEGDKLDGHNYYGRLAPLLGYSAEVIEEHFDIVAGWWGDLDAWLQRQGGSRGISTIVEHPRLKKVGYPLSQALVRESDRRTLRQFFKHAGIDRRRVSGPELASALVNWATPGRAGLSARFRSLITARGERTLLARILEAEARAWDGVTIDVPNRPRGLTARLLFQPRSQRICWVAELPEGVPGRQAFGTCRGVSTRELAGGRYLGLDSPAFRSQDLIGGYRLAGSKGLLRWTARSIVPLLSDPSLDGWVSTRRLSMHEEQLLLIADSYWPDVVSYLEETGVPFQPIEGVPGLGGLKLARFEASALQSWGAAELAMPDELAAIWPEDGERARLDGGLMLRPGSGQRTYLVGGAPDLELPINLQPRTVALSVDGQTTTHDVEGTSFELADLAVSPGSYTISAGGTELRFRLIESGGLFQAPDAGQIGWSESEGAVAWRSARLQLDALEGAIRGAMLSEPSPSRARTIRTGGCSTLFLIGENPGELQEIPVSAWAPYKDLFNLERAGSVGVDLRFLPTWIVRDWSVPGARPQAKATPVQFAVPHDGLEPTPAPGPDAIMRWRRELKRLSAASTDVRWQRLALRSWYTTG